MMNAHLKQMALLIAILFSFQGWSQTITMQAAPAVPSPVESCAFDSRHQEKMINDPVYFQNTVDFNNAMENYVPTKVGNTTLRVPVVVHVMDDGTSLTQITDEQIREGIQRINERFRKVPGSLGDGNGVDTELEFVLAVRDPSGNCTNGIVRYDFTGNSTYTSSGVFADAAGVSDDFLKAQSFWNSSNYYNFWLVSEIDNNNGGAGIQGYAYFASAHGLAYDGTVILCNSFKNGASTTGTHELGHAFNLFHTFQGDANGSTCPTNANCNVDGDRVCDTPPHIRSLYDCTVSANACDGGSSSDLYIHNYLDYSSDACQSEFTAGQKVRINNAMTVARGSFLASNGNMSLIPPAPPIVEFQASAEFFCQGDPIQFFDISSCIPNTFLDSTYWSGITFNWTFTDGTNTYNSALQNPLMNFPTPGVYDVTLTVTNASGSNTLTETAFFTIGASPIAACTPTSNNEGNFQQTVSGVSFSGINNNTASLGNVGYTDFTCEANTIVTVGTTYPLEVTINSGGSGPEVAEVYIDYNNNGTFEAAELVLSGTTGGTNTTQTLSGNITIPGTAVQNVLLRMRVIGETNTINANERACLSSFFIGDVEDYGVYIEANCTAPAIALGTVTNPTSCSGNGGMIEITGSGTGTVNWSGTASGNSGIVNLPYTIMGLGAGSYSINLSISASCASNTLNQTLTEPLPTTIAIGTTSDPTICTATDGTIQITGSGTGEVTWSGPAGGGNSGIITLPYTISGIPAGLYNISFSSTNGCPSNLLDHTLTDPAAVTIAIGTVTDPTVCLGTDGTIEITGSGMGELSWIGTTNGSSGPITLPYTITGLSAGATTVFFDGTNGCSSNTLDQSLNDPGAPTIAIGTVFDPTSCNGTNGTIEINGSGTGDISWSGTTSGTSTGVTLPFIITGLTAGNYSIDFTSSTGCSSNTITGSLGNPAIPSISVGTITDPSVCSATDGSIQITGSGTGTIAWTGTTSGSLPVSSFPFTITGLGAGSYTVEFTESNGCTSSNIMQVLSDPAAPTIAVGTISNPTVCAGSDGSIQITGSGNGTVNWTGAATGTSGSITLPFTITGLAAGSYTIDFTSSTGCASNTVSETITDPSLPAAPVVTVVDDCGSSTLTATGSNLIWSTTETTTSINVTVAGTYTVTQTVGGCTSTAGSGVAAPLAIPAAPTVTVVDGCGTSTLSATGTNHLWSTTETTASITVNTAGTYTVTQTVGGCESTSASGVAAPTAVPSAPVVAVLDGCGSSTLTTTGTNLVWSTTETTPSINVSTAGTFTVTQTVNGCTSPAGSGVAAPESNPVIATGVISNVTACLGSDGTIEITGNGTGDISWSGSATGTGTGITLPFTITGLVAGTYSIDFTSTAGCASNTITGTLTEPGSPTIAIGTFADPTTCSGSDGSIEITGSETGDISWTGAASGTSVGITLPFTITGLAAGAYTVDFTTSTGCSSNTVNQSITDPSAPSAPIISASGTTTFCAGGSVDLSSSYASGNDWTTAAGTQIITVSNTGTYNVTHTDANGCSSTSAPVTVTVNALPAVPTVTPSGPTTFCDGGSVDLTSSETTGNIWSTTSSAQTITVTTSGSYDVQFTDGNGCSALSSPTVITVNTLPTAPTITASGSTTICAGQTVDLSSSELTGNVWSTADATQDITVSTSGSYDVTFTDGNGCSATSAATNVVVNPLPPSPVITASGSTFLCVGQTVDLTSSQATGNAWSTLDLTQTITVSTTGTYDVTYTDGNGCSSISAPVTVSGGNQPTVSGGANETICDGDMVTLSGSGAQTYVWDNGILDNVPFTPAVGTITYTVTGTDANGCTNTAVVDVTVSPIPTVTVTTDLTTCVYNSPSTLIGTPAGGVFLGPNISGNQFDPASAGIGTHTIYYEFESQDGCVGESTTTIVVEACASIEDISGIDVKVYPNPMQSSLNIEFDGDFAITLYDSRGRLVFQDAGTDSLTISTVDYESGIYLVQISSDQINSTIRVVKN